MEDTVNPFDSIEAPHSFDSGGIYASILESGWKRLCDTIRPFVNELDSSVEVQVICAISLFATRYAMATVKLGQLGYNTESNALLRSVTELCINHTYIFYSSLNGITDEFRKQEERRKLSFQFAAYADLKYAKFVQDFPDQAESAMRKHYGYTEDQLTQWREKVSQQKKAAEKIGCSSRRWHKEDLSRMAKAVAENYPPFFPCIVRNYFLKNLGTLNSAVHVDALAMRTQLNAKNTGLLELGLEEYMLSADTAALLASCTWLMTAEYFCKLEEARSFIRELLNEEVQRRSRLG